MAAGLLVVEPQPGCLAQLLDVRRERGDAAAVCHPLDQQLRDHTRVAHQHHVGAVVLRRVAGVDVDHEQPARLRLRPVLRARPVQIAADRDDEVGVVPQLAALGHERRQPDVGRVLAPQQARRLIGRQHGGGDLARQLANRLAGPGAHGAATRPDQRTLGGGDQLQSRIEVGLFQLRSPLVVGRLRLFLAGLREQQVSRDLQVDRTTRRQLRDLQRGRHHPLEHAHVRDAQLRLRDGAEERGLVGCLVQHAAVDARLSQSGGNVGRDHDDRGAAGPRLTGGAERVCRTRPGRDERDPGTPRRARVAVRRIRRRLLVAHAHEPDRRLRERAPDGEVVHARQPEHHLHARPLECADDQRAAVHPAGATSEFGRVSLSRESFAGSFAVSTKKHQ